MVTVETKQINGRVVVVADFGPDEPRVTLRPLNWSMDADQAETIVEYLKAVLRVAKIYPLAQDITIN